MSNNKLSDTQVKDIIKLLAERKSHKKISLLYGVSEASIAMIANYKTQQARRCGVKLGVYSDPVSVDSRIAERVMAYITASGEPLKVNQIAVNLGLTASGVRPHLMDMVAKGTVSAVKVGNSYKYAKAYKVKASDIFNTLADCHKLVRSFANA